LGSQHVAASLPVVKTEAAMGCCDVVEQSTADVRLVLPEQRPVMSSQHTSAVVPSVKAEDEISC